jgi:hypothetical protein
MSGGKLCGGEEMVFCGRASALAERVQIKVKLNFET